MGRYLKGKPNISDLLIISDIDGTLTSGGNNIPQKNVDVINRFIQLGGKFTIATGRTYACRFPFEGLFQPSFPAITCNGGCIYDFKTASPIWELILNENAPKLWEHLSEQFPTIGAQILCGRQIFVPKTNRHIEENIELEGFEYVTPIQSADEVTLPIRKIIMMGDEEEVDELTAYARSLTPDGISLVRSDKRYLEILPEGCTKALALPRLAELANVKMENTIMIGDYLNDLEIIKAAGIGVATGNAPQELKDIADFVVCDSKYGSVADLIERVLQDCNL